MLLLLIVKLFPIRRGAGWTWDTVWPRLMSSNLAIAPTRAEQRKLTKKLFVLLFLAWVPYLCIFGADSILRGSWKSKASMFMCMCVKQMQALPYVCVFLWETEGHKVREGQRESQLRVSDWGYAEEGLNMYLPGRHSIQHTETVVLPSSTGNCCSPSRCKDMADVRAQF